MFDFKSYFEPYLNKIEGHSKYAAFRFLQSDDLGVEMHYKQSSSDPWEPTKKVNEKLVSDKGLQIIQVHQLRFICNYHYFSGCCSTLNNFFPS